MILFSIVMKNCFVFVLFFFAAVVAAELSDDCKYVNDTFILNVTDSVERCFNSYQVDQDFIDTILLNLELIQDVYPYTEIASNPPKNPPGYFKPMNYATEFEELKEKLAKSNGTISKVFRSTMAFIKGFRDIHFSLFISPGSEVENIFAPVYGVVPFNWMAVTQEDQRLVIMAPSTFTDAFIPGGSDFLNEKLASFIPAVTVDGKDAFEFFSEFMGNYNQMKSTQGRLFFAEAMTNMPFQLLDSPLDNAFDNHTITFMDGSSLSFKLGFYNAMYMPEDQKASFKPNGLSSNHVSPQREKYIQKLIENVDSLKKEKKSEATPQVVCGQVADMNYITISSFSPKSESQFILELIECVDMFDENDKPITIILSQNAGGSTALRELAQFLLMPASDTRTLRAARKTDTTRYLGVDQGEVQISDVFDQCKTYTPYETSQFWDKEDHDVFGNDVVHTRTKKFFESFKSSFEFVAKHCLHKNIRKPTDIIVATDGLCLSSCAFFVDNSILSGSAIVAGFGVTTPGDELFVAGQCPSRAELPADYFFDLQNRSQKFGLTFQTSFLESYNVSEKKDEIIPGDYDILRVDVHTGYDNALQLDTDQLISTTIAVHEEFKTKCNPANKRLFFVTEDCGSKDPNALFSGHPCGKNGEWDKSTCKISSCKPGYVVDFEHNKCVVNHCDPRQTHYPPVVVSSSSPSSSKVTHSSSESASSSLYPLFSVFIAVFMLIIHFTH